MVQNEVTRRAFLTGIAAGTAVIAANGRAQEPESAYPKGLFVDIHTHITLPYGVKQQLTVNGLLEWMDENDVAQAIVMPLISPEAWDHAITPDYVLEQTVEYRDRLIPFCDIDPRTLYVNAYEAKVNLLRRYKDAGAKGLGEHKCGVPIDDPQNIEVFAAAAEVGLPILFHLDNARNTDAPGLPGLAKVLETVSAGTFIGHANGWWASISGDVTQADFGKYPNTKVAPGGAIDDLMDRYPNIYGDLSAFSGANAILRDMEFGREFLKRRADRLLFGTDYLAPKQEVPQLSLYREVEIPDDVRAKICRENARRILGV